MLVQHHLLYLGMALPAPTGLYDYLIAENGIFLHSRRAELAALLPLTRTTIRGLAPSTPYFEMAVPRVPAALLTQTLTQARAAHSTGGEPVEILFHLAWVGDWSLIVPPQRQSATEVQLLPLPAPLAPAPVMEIHSHHRMAAFWSATDDADETGLAVYAVLGRVFDQPQVCVRLGVYGHWWEIPASWVFDLPATITDRYRGNLPPFPCRAGGSYA